MLHIVKSNEPMPVERTVITLYGPPGHGKSTLSYSAANPLLLDFDMGAHRAIHRKDTVRVSKWSDVVSMRAEDVEPYDTLVLDTVGRALDQLSADIIDRDPKRGRGGALDLQGWGQLKYEFISWLNLMRSYGCDIVLVAHGDEQGRGDDMVERIDVPGSSKNEIYKVSDAMGRLIIRDGKRMLLFSPSDTAFGKNPGGTFSPLEVPNFKTPSTFLADIIEQTKDAINSMTEEQSEVAQLLEDWSELVSKATTAKKLNTLLKKIEKLDERIMKTAKRMLWDFAKDHSFDYDKEKHEFYEVAEEEEGEGEEVDEEEDREPGEEG